jgi:hypothetical protein
MPVMIATVSVKTSAVTPVRTSRGNGMLADSSRASTRVPAIARTNPGKVARTA